MTTPTPALPRLNPERLFFGGMGLVILAIVVVGFGPSFFVRGIVAPYNPVLPLTPLIIVHAAVFSAWVLLFITQTALIRKGQVRWHQRLGVFGLLLAAAMFVLGIEVGAQQVMLGRTPPGVHPLEWFAFPLLDICVFVVLVGAGFAMRRDAQTHKRLMLFATILLLQAAIGRLPFPPDVLYGEIPTIVAWSMSLTVVAWDLISRGRVHPATIFGAGLLAAEHVFRLLVWRSDAWHDFAGWIVAAVT
jgi:uncharacterized membrane protein YozB (DUF420 family)